MKYIIGLLIVFCSSAIAAETPIMQLDRNMQPEYMLVTDGDHIRRISEEREYSEPAQCEHGWREVTRVSDILICGKPIR